MIYLKQIKLNDPTQVEGAPEELKYPYSAAAIRHVGSIVFNNPVTFLVGENGIGKSTLLEAVMLKYDEPEAAFSPQRQLALLVRMKELVDQNCQLIISTHSPILMAYPGADIYTIHADGACITPYQETEHYQLTQYFLNHTEQMLKELFG